MTTHAVTPLKPLFIVVQEAMRVQPRPRRDLVTEVTIVGAAALATAGFVIASVVDAMLLPRKRRRARGS